MRRRLGARPDVGERSGGVRTTTQRGQRLFVDSCWMFVKVAAQILNHTHSSDTWGDHRPRLRWRSPCCWTPTGPEEEAASWGKKRENAESFSFEWVIGEDLRRLSWNPLLAVSVWTYSLSTLTTRRQRKTLHDEVSEFLLLARLTWPPSAEEASQVCPARPAGGVSSSPLTALLCTVKEEHGQT